MLQPTRMSLIWALNKHFEKSSKFLLKKPTNLALDQPSFACILLRICMKFLIWVGNLLKDYFWLLWKVTFFLWQEFNLFKKSKNFLWINDCLSACSFAAYRLLNSSKVRCLSLSFWTRTSMALLWQLAFYFFFLLALHSFVCWQLVCFTFWWNFILFFSYFIFWLIKASDNTPNNAWHFWLLNIFVNL